MSLLSNEQFGTDLSWWTGQIVDDAYWKDNSIPQKWSDVSEIAGWGARYKVRIFGNHPQDFNELSDDDLPWVDIMYPVTAGSGHAASYQTSNLRKGSFVVGIFRDKEQREPLILGCLGNNDQIDLKYAQTYRGFIPFSGFGGQQPERVPTFSQSNSNAKLESNTTNSTTQKTKADAVEEKSERLPTPIRQPSNCSVEANEIQVQIQKLIQDIETFKDNFQNNLITEEGRSFGLQEYIQYKVLNVSTLISTKVKSWIKFIRKYVLEKVNAGLKDLYFLIFPEDRPKAKTALEKALELLSCLFDKIIKNLIKMIGGFLMNIVDRYINVPLCAVDNFISQILGDIIGSILGAVDSILGPLKSIFGAVDFAMSGLQLLLDILGFFTCNTDPECSEIKQWSIWDGAGNNGGLSLDINGIFDRAKGVADSFTQSINNIDDFDFNIDFAGMLQNTATSCNTGPLLCGPPKISIYGGGGHGAAGNAVVRAVGDILSVDLTSTGSGYTKVPFVKIIDDCGIGNGAHARAIMGVVPPTLSITSTKNPNGTFTVCWKTDRAEKISNSLGANTLNGCVTFTPGEGTQCITAFGKPYNGTTPYITQCITFNTATEEFVFQNPLFDGAPIDDDPGFVTSPIPEYDGFNPKPKRDVCSVEPVIENLIVTGKFTSADIGVVNIVLEEAGANYLSSPNGSLGGDGRVWAEKEDTVIRRGDGTYDKPYKPGEVVDLSRCDDVIPPEEPQFRVEEELSYTAPALIETELRQIRGNLPTKEDGAYPVYLYLCDVKISDGGVNYDKDFDTISVTPDNGAVLEPEFGPEGKLIGIKILKNGFGFTERPIITVNTTTGFNAKIDPVLCVNRLDDDEEAASRILPEEVITVIDCVGKIGSS